MEKLSYKKRSTIVGDYLSAMSYSEIAAKQHVSTGTVANVVADLKAGTFPEVGEIGEHIEQLKELSLDLKQANLTPVKCALGLMVLARINECGLDPADIERWPLILKSINSQDEAQQFIKLTYSIQEVQKRTGLSIDALDNKAHELEKKAAELEPIAEKASDYKKQVADLTRKKTELTEHVTTLEQKQKILVPQVRDLETRKNSLSSQLSEMEPRAKKAEMAIKSLNLELTKLQDAGFTAEGLAEFNQKLQAVGRRHGIKTGDLRSRLLHELEILDKGLGLEVLIKNKKLELSNMGKDIASNNRELETTKAAVSSLKQEKANLEAGIKETREYVSQEIARIIPVARNTLAQLTKELQTGVANALAGVSQLRDKSLEAGKEVGRCQEIIETNAWLKDLFALVKGEQSIEAKQVKAIALMVARGIAVWLKTQDKNHYSVFSLSVMLDNLIKELEEWKV